MDWIDCHFITVDERAELARLNVVFRYVMRENGFSIMVNPQANQYFIPRYSSNQ